VSVQLLEARLASIPSGAGRFAAIVAWAKALTDDAIDARGGQKAVEVQVLALYETYVVPLDLPGVPALAEPAVDALLKRIISALIWSVDDES
jgi:hypothetical protein